MAAMTNRIFFPQASLDEWIMNGVALLEGAELRLVHEGRRYAIVEGVHVTTEVTGSPEATKLVGFVKSKAALEELGAEILESSMVLGENAYEVRPGWVGLPSTSLDEFVRSSDGTAALQRMGLAANPPATDEALLGIFLAANPT